MQALANPKIRLIERFEATKENLQKIFDMGYEGAVAKQWNKPIPIGQKTNSYWFKIKGDENRTVDAFIVGVTEGTSGGSGLTGVKPVPDGTAASFTMAMMRDGKIVEIGKMHHLPETVKKHGLNQYGKFQHRVVEMRVSGWNGKAFRWPRWVKLRGDKTPDDCLYEEQVGKKGGR